MERNSNVCWHFVIWWKALGSGAQQLLRGAFYAVSVGKGCRWQYVDVAGSCLLIDLIFQLQLDAEVLSKFPLLTYVLVCVLLPFVDLIKLLLLCHKVSISYLGLPISLLPFSSSFFSIRNPPGSSVFFFLIWGTFFRFLYGEFLGAYCVHFDCCQGCAFIQLSVLKDVFLGFHSILKVTFLGVSIWVRCHLGVPHRISECSCSNPAFAPESNFALTYRLRGSDSSISGIPASHPQKRHRGDSGCSIWGSADRRFPHTLSLLYLTNK